MKKSISFKISFFLILIIAVVFVLGTGIYYSLAREEIKKEYELSVQGLQEQITSSLAYPLWNFDDYTTKSICKVFLKNELITGIHVIDTKKNTVFQGYSEKFSGKMVESDIVLSEKIVGKLMLAVSPDAHFNREKKRILNYSLSLGMTCLIIFIFMKLLLAAYIFNPLQAISTGMLEVSQGDYDQTIHEDHGNELALITQAFNKMSKAILERDQDLRQRQEQFRNLFETMRQGVLYLDESGVIISANPAASRILKIPTDRLVGLSWPQPGYQYINEDGSLIAGEDLPCRASLKKGTPVRNQIMGMIDKNDKTCTWISVDTVLNEALGKDEAYRIYMMIDDVTEQLHMQNLMVQTEKMMAVGGLAAGIAHEINNPLGIILQTAQNLERRLGMELKKNHEIAGSIGLDYDKMQRYLKERSIDQYIRNIMTAGIRASDIIKNLLDFSRSSESKRTVCHIHSMLDDVIEMAANDYDLKKKYDFKSIEIIRDYSEVGPINCIKTEISQVFLNIIKNAAQAMGRNPGSGVRPQLIIRTENTLGGGVRIRITDNGPGISPKDQKSIFQPFFTTKPVGEGTGLGLSVSYFIIHSHHKGNIRVESEKEKGCCFVIDLPKG